jgi:hypothetical protein
MRSQWGNRKNVFMTRAGIFTWLIATAAIAATASASCGGKKSVSDAGSGGTSDAGDGGASSAGDGGTSDAGSGGTQIDCTRVLEGDQELRDAAALDELLGVREINGNLILGDVGSPHLDQLSCLEVLHGSLVLGRLADYTDTLIEYENTSFDTSEYAEWIVNDSLQTLQGLSNLRQIDGDLMVPAQTALTSLKGLSKLELIKGNVAFGWCALEEGDYSIYLFCFGSPELATLDGLSSLHEVGGNLTVVANHKLRTLDGLSNLARIGGNLNIGVNRTVRITEMECAYDEPDGVCIGGGSDGNGTLASLGGLAALETVGGKVTVVDNPHLPQCEADQFIERLQSTGWDQELSTWGNDDEATCD